MVLKYLLAVAFVSAANLAPTLSSNWDPLPECLREAGEGSREVDEARTDGQNGHLYNGHSYAAGFWTKYGNFFSAVEGGEAWIEEMADLPRESGVPTGGDCRQSGRHERAEEMRYEFLHEMWPDGYPRPRKD